MPKFYFSIGVQYDRMPHPRLRMDSHSLVYFEAENEDRARQIFVNHMQPYPQAWSFMYTEDDVSFQHFPGGPKHLMEVLWPALPTWCDAPGGPTGRESLLPPDAMASLPLLHDGDE